MTTEQEGRELPNEELKALSDQMIKTLLADTPESREFLQVLAEKVLEVLKHSPARRDLLRLLTLEQVTALFPDFPQEVSARHEYEARRVLRARRTDWYLRQGFPPRVATSLAASEIDPLRLLTMTEREIHDLRGLGMKAWTEIQVWQQAHKDLIPETG